MSDHPPFPGPDECWHDSATGIDQTDPRHPDKVWQCDVCGWLYRTVPVPDCPGVSRMIDA